MFTAAATLEQNLRAVEQRIASAAQRAGRKPEQITLIAVTKTFPAGAILEAYALGIRHFGENYVQEFEAKYPHLASLSDAHFHLIGHLQSNKARRAAALFQCVQTVDSIKLAHRLNTALAEQPPGAGARRLDVFVEVKLSPEQTKSGIEEQHLPQLIEALRALPHLRLHGLMTMPPWSDDPQTSRPYFRRLKQLAEQFHLSELSMGMSHDFEVAIEEGATHIRIGTALFGPRKRP